MLRVTARLINQIRNLYLFKRKLHIIRRNLDIINIIYNIVNSFIKYSLKSYYEDS